MTIEEKLNDSYKYLTDKYSELSILGLFTVGSVNYRLSADSADMVLVGIYIPAFEDLCILPNMTWDDNGIIMIDIRSMYNSMYTCKWGALELLYSNYYIITDYYLKLFNEKILANKTIVANCDKLHRIEICFDRALKSIAEEKYAEAVRLDIACDLYVNGLDCEDIFHIKNKHIISSILDIKDGKREFNQEDKDIIISNFHEYIKIAKTFNNNREEADKIIKNGIISIISAGLEGRVSHNDFFEELTETELAAYNILLSKFKNGEAQVSISKLVEESSISRPVFKNLLLKMEKYKVATIVNKGAKGTYIKLKGE